MPRKWPDPWPTTPLELREWQINNGYDFLLERLELPEELFMKNPNSLDGIALTMIAFTTLAEYYGRYNDRINSKKTSGYGKDTRRFRLLLDIFAPSFTNRISIPVLARAIRDATSSEMKALLPILKTILQAYPVEKVPLVRRIDEDPTRVAFEILAKESGWTLPETMFNKADYAGLLIGYYRHSVVHELTVAGGREAEPLLNDLYSMSELPFYSNHSNTQARDNVDHVRFGFRPLGILALAKEAIENVRTWAHQSNEDIFIP